MKPRVLVCGTLVLVGVLALVGGEVYSQDKPEGAMPEMSAEQQAEMQMWMKLATPGEHHKRLEHFVGMWTTKSTFWMGGPGAPPTVSDGVSSVKWVLGERFLLEHYRGTAMGMPFEGLGMCGYDNVRNMYVSSWCDNMGTYLYTQDGSYNAKENAFTYYGEMNEPKQPKPVYGKMVRSVVRIVDADTHVMEMYDLHVAEDFKVMEIRYTRQK